MNWLYNKYIQKKMKVANILLPTNKLTNIKLLPTKHTNC